MDLIKSWKKWKQPLGRFLLMSCHNVMRNSSFLRLVLSGGRCNTNWGSWYQFTIIYSRSQNWRKRLITFWKNSFLLVLDSLMVNNVRIAAQKFSKSTLISRPTLCWYLVFVSSYLLNVKNMKLIDLKRWSFVAEINMVKNVFKLFSIQGESDTNSLHEFVQKHIASKCDN